MRVDPTPINKALTESPYLLLNWSANPVCMHDCYEYNNIYSTITGL